MRNGVGARNHKYIADSMIGGNIEFPYPQVLELTVVSTLKAIIG